MNERRGLAAAAVALGVAVVAVVAAGCGGGGSSPTSGGVAEDERGSVGVPPASVEYCQKLGYTIVDGRCRFPDGTSCEEWSFYYAECGQAHSWCELHGGQVSSQSRDMGTWSAVVAVCAIDGKTCAEDPLYKTGSCP